MKLYALAKRYANQIAMAAQANQKPGAALANYCRTLEKQDEIRKAIETESR